MAAHKVSSLSVFVPCYNEELSVEPLVLSLSKVLPRVAKEFEVLIVNGGSHDGTKKVASQLAKQFEWLRVVSHQENRGYGAALKTGFANASLDWTFFMDGDLQFDPAELASFVEATRDHAAVIGYRTRRAEGFKRHAVTLLFKLYVKLLFGFQVKDIDCAFKLFRTSDIKKIKLTTNGAMISTELLYKLNRNGVVWQELPVTHYPRKFGVPTGNNWRVILRALSESLRLRWQLLLAHFST